MRPGESLHFEWCVLAGDHSGPCVDENGRSERTVAALYVETKGVYSNLPGVELWDEARDARQYAGPHPVVAHPPCARWSRLAGFTEARFGYKRGEDGGCFEAALIAVRTYGGVLEHPAFSSAWDRFNLPEPIWRSGWNLGFDGGASCYIEQGRYGLPVKKATWLYAYGVDLPELRWGYTPDGEGDQPNGEWGGLENWRDRFKGRHEQWTKGQHRGGHHGLTATTPPEFRDELLAMARTAMDIPRPVAVFDDVRFTSLVDDFDREFVPHCDTEGL